MTPRYAAKTDKNHAEIRDGLRKLGFSVIDTFQLGGGVPDMVVIGPQRTNLFQSWVTNYEEMTWWEVKDEGGELTEKEKVFFDKYRHHETIRICRTIEDVLEWYGWT